MAEITVALAGIGGYGEFYARGLLDEAALHGVRFAAAVDPAPERSRLRGEIEAAGIPFFRSLEDLYARLRPDLVILATPIPVHASQAILALGRGSSVLCEKPMAATVQDALAMRDAERASGGRFLAVGFQWCFSEAIRTLKADIAAGAFGRPRVLKTMVQWPRDSSYYGRNRWAGRIKDDSGAWVLDNPLSNATAHYLHNMLYLLGRGETLSATPLDLESELYRANPIESFDTAALRLATDTGAGILFLTTHACQAVVGPVSIFEFENAVVTYTQGSARGFQAQYRDGRERTYGDPDAGLYRKLWLCTEAVRGGQGVPCCGIEAALPHLICVNAVQDSPDAIVDVPEFARAEQPSRAGATLRSIRGVGDLFALCFERGMLPHETEKAAWTAPARMTEVAGYRRFPRSSTA